MTKRKRLLNSIKELSADLQTDSWSETLQQTVNLWPDSSIFPELEPVDSLNCKLREARELALKLEKLCSEILNELTNSPL